MTAPMTRIAFFVGRSKLYLANLISCIPSSIQVI